MSIHPLSHPTPTPVQADTPDVTTKRIVAQGDQAQPVGAAGTQGHVSPVAKDKVTISSTGKAMAEELTETHAQTAKEARGGDRRAKKLLAKQAKSEEITESSFEKNREAKGLGNEK